MRRLPVGIACVLGLGGLGTLSSGCVVVKPYQREALALRPMSGDAERDEDHFRQHWQESREGSNGGYGSAGGGCGCN